MAGSAIESPTTTASSAIDQALVELQRGAKTLASLSLDRRMKLAGACAAGVISLARDWVDEACLAKRIPPASPARAEEVAAGPLAVLRYLRLLSRTFGDLARYGSPRLPGPIKSVDGQLRVPVVPTRALFDRIVFSPLRAETWIEPGIGRDQLFGNLPARLLGSVALTPTVTLVLGAGNVASIPITDALTKIFQDSSAVLLKMNPVNSYLGKYFEQACQSLVEAGFLRIVYGAGDVGAQLVADPRVDEVHITGSADTHDRIVWGSDADQQRERQAARQPLLTKKVTSELGNVTPWIVVPGEYSSGQLRFQAENIASSIINNASFNCIATKVLVTWKPWHLRERFLDTLAAILRDTPPRYAYYPGAAQRYRRFAGNLAATSAPDELPWTLLRDVDPQSAPHCFQEESFVCVCAETALDATSEDEFLSRAVDFANERLWGTLAAALTVPSALQARDERRLDQALARLRYGVIGVNQWPGVAYALMSIPWGGHPDVTLDDVQSGIGSVHNTYLLAHPEKTVLRSPLTMFPKPIWFPTHRNPESVAWRLFDLYRQPSIWRLPSLLTSAIRA